MRSRGGVCGVRRAACRSQHREAIRAILLDNLPAEMIAAEVLGARCGRRPRASRRRWGRCGRASPSRAPPAAAAIFASPPSFCWRKRQTRALARSCDRRRALHGSVTGKGAPSRRREERHKSTHILPGIYNPWAAGSSRRPFWFSTTLPAAARESHEAARLEGGGLVGERALASGKRRGVAAACAARSARASASKIGLQGLRAKAWRSIPPLLAPSPARRLAGVNSLGCERPAAERGRARCSAACASAHTPHTMPSSVRTSSSIEALREEVESCAPDAGAAAQKRAPTAVVRRGARRRPASVPPRGDELAATPRLALEAALDRHAAHERAEAARAEGRGAGGAMHQPLQ